MIAEAENGGQKVDKALEEEFQPHILLISTPSDQANIQLIKTPYEKLSQLYQYPDQVERVSTFFRLPLWLEACLLVEFTLICATFYRLQGLDRHLFYALLLAFLWPLSALLTSSSGYWTPLSPILTVIFIGWAFSSYLSSKWRLRRSSSAMPKEEKKELERFN